MNKSMYQISADLLDIYEQISSGDGEITEELEINLEVTQEDLEKKLTNYYNFIKKLEEDNVMLEAKEKLYKEEMERIKRKRSQQDKLSNKLQEAIIVAIKMFGTERHYTPKQKEDRAARNLPLDKEYIVGDITFKNTTKESLLIVDEEAVKKTEYVRCVLKDKLSRIDMNKVKALLESAEFNLEVDKSRLTDYLKTNRKEFVDGARLDNKTTLNFK